MPSREELAMHDLAKANVALASVDLALGKFRMRVTAGDWLGCEDARSEVLGHFEAYLDHLTAAYQVVHGAR